MSTKIEWCDETINPIQDRIKGESGRGYHCTKRSPGCLNCYAETINNRFGNHLPFDGRKAEFELIESELHKLAKWKKPRSVFVQSMGDLFHEAVPDEFIFSTFDLICACRGRHTFLILTKRPERAVEWYKKACSVCSGWFHPFSGQLDLWETWTGLTVCNQQEADEKIPVFLKVPGKRFLSIEPMLGEIDIRVWAHQCITQGCGDQLSAVILGGETGPKARPMNPDWVRSVRDQCEAAGTDFFFKGWGEYFPRELWEDNPELVLPDDQFASEYEKVGKKKSGRILDGRTHDDLAWSNPK